VTVTVTALGQIGSDEDVDGGAEEIVAVEEDNGIVKDWACEEDERLELLETTAEENWELEDEAATLDIVVVDEETLFEDDDEDIRVSVALEETDVVGVGSELVGLGLGLSSEVVVETTANEDELELLSNGKVELVMLKLLYNMVSK
jgi:hypothetical protein